MSSWDKISDFTKYRSLHAIVLTVYVLIMLVVYRVEILSLSEILLVLLFSVAVVFGLMRRKGMKLKDRAVLVVLVFSIFLMVKFVLKIYSNVMEEGDLLDLLVQFLPMIGLVGFRVNIFVWILFIALLFSTILLIWRPFTEEKK